MAHQAIEFHDSAVRSICYEGIDAVLEMRVYIHSSEGRPGLDEGQGWFQDAKIVISGAEVAQRPENDSLDIYDGSVRVAEEHFDNNLPLPCDLIGQVEIDFSGDQGLLVVKGRGIRVVLTGGPGPIENFRP